MRFVPVKFGKAYGAVNQSDARNALKFTPPTLTILPTQTGAISDATTAGNQFNAGNLPDDFEVHADRCYQVVWNGANIGANASDEPQGTGERLAESQKAGAVTCRLDCLVRRFCSGLLLYDKNKFVPFFPCHLAVWASGGTPG